MNSRKETMDNKDSWRYMIGFGALFLLASNQRHSLPEPLTCKVAPEGKITEVHPRYSEMSKNQQRKLKRGYQKTFHFDDN